MHCIIYGGVRYRQVRHAIYCKLCKDTIESKDEHDFKWCSCGSIGIDGGIKDGNRILGNMSYIETRSMYSHILNKKWIWLPQSVIEEKFRRYSSNPQSSSI